MVNPSALAHRFVLELGDGFALSLRERRHSEALFQRVNSERAHLLRGGVSWAGDLTREGAERLVKSGLEQFAAGNGWQADAWHEGVCIGSLGLHHLHGPGGSTEPGFYLHEASTGRGLMTQVLTRLLPYFFDARKLAHVRMRTALGNRQSERVAERLGMRETARLRSALRTPDGLVDVRVWDLSRADFEARGGGRFEHLPRFALRVDDEVHVGLLEREDAPALHAHIERERERLARFLPWAHAQDAAGTLGFITQLAMPALVKGNDVHAGVWVQGKLVGTLSLHDVQHRHGSAEVGYWLASSAVGQGVLTRAMHAWLDRAFIVLSLTRVVVRSEPENARSRAVPERLGFVHEGVIPAALAGNGSYRDLEIYSMLRLDWLARGSA